MLLKVDAETMAAALKKALKAVPRNPSWDMLDQFLLVARGSRLTIAATTLEWFLAVRVDARIEQEGRTLVDARTLTETLSCYTGEVELATVSRIRDGRQQAFLKVAGGGESLVPIDLYDLEDFPLPRRAEGKRAVVDGEELAEAIQDAAIAMSKDESRPAMTGIFFRVHPDSGSLWLVTTDGYRMALREVKLLETDFTETESFLLPGADLKNWATLKPKGPVVIQMQEQTEKSNAPGFAAFRSKDFSSAFLVMEEKFPEYMQVYSGIVAGPKTAKLQTDSKAFLKALKPLKPIAAAKGRILVPVVMRVNGSIELSAYDGEREAVVPLPGQVEEKEAEEVKVGFQWKYMVDAVKRASKRKLPVEVSLSDPSRPIYMRMGGNYEYILMPTRLE